MTILYLVRHGQSDWNAANRFQGHVDRPLTDLGRTQAEALARELASIALEAIYSSPLRRALDTATAVAAGRDLEVVADDGLREVDVGSWAGLTRAEVEERFPAEFRRWVEGGDGWEDGETYEEMSTRAARDRPEHRGGPPGRGCPRRLPRRPDPGDPGRRRGHDRPRVPSRLPRRAQRGA